VAQPAAFTLRHGVGSTDSAVHALAASNGAFSTHVPLTQAGKATITATGEKSHLSLAATVSVLPAPGVSGSRSTQSTKQALPFASIELLIGALAIVVLLFVGVTAWQRRSRKPSAAFDTSTT
jgi:hypothetical protein